MALAVLNCKVKLLTHIWNIFPIKHLGYINEPFHFPLSLSLSLLSLLFDPEEETLNNSLLVKFLF